MVSAATFSLEIVLASDALRRTIGTVNIRVAAVISSCKVDRDRKLVDWLGRPGMSITEDHCLTEKTIGGRQGVTQLAAASRSGAYVGRVHSAV
jgi:hypothetical protein